MEYELAERIAILMLNNNGMAIETAYAQAVREIKERGE